MEMFVAGEWRLDADRLEVHSPFTGTVIDEVPEASERSVADALAAADTGAAAMAALPAHRRAALLEASADVVASRVAELAELITREQGKTTTEATGEAGRIAPMLRACAAEAVRRTGEVLAMDAAPAGEGRLGFTLPEPCGVVLAITPFNYPALLVLHKVGPALAAGNAVLLKPAVTTPLTALWLTRALLEADWPDGALQCITGSGSRLGPLLCASPLVRKISFTGSVGVGHAIARAAGAKRLTCELGSNAAVVVLDDADVVHAAKEIVRSGFVNAGQVCISAQRVLVAPGVRDELVGAVLDGVDALRPGDPADPATTLGPLITASEAERVVGVIEAARETGATILRGGGSESSLVEPSVVLDPSEDSAVWDEELFGPAVAIRASTADEAVAAANRSRYGLSMSVFTQDVDRALAFARGIRSGMVHVNSGPLFRIDSMPYGGVRDSGFGKEGIRYAMDEMTEHKLVVLHPGANAS